MKLKFRKAFSLLCALSMLMTSIPFLVISEESVEGTDVTTNLSDQVSKMTEEVDAEITAGNESAENVPSDNSSLKKKLSLRMYAIR